MLTYPSLFPNAIHVYDHLFLTIGNGYEWQDGKLVYDDENSLCDNIEEAINRVFENNISTHNIILFDIKKCPEQKVIENVTIQCIKSARKHIHTILNIENLLDDLSIPDMYDPELGNREGNKFKFYGLSKYSAIANIPDDVHYDWIKAIKDFVDILDKNKDKFKDCENLFDGIKERVNSLFVKRVEDYIKQLG
jgi:hypothetical protein